MTRVRQSLLRPLSVLLLAAVAGPAAAQVVDAAAAASRAASAPSAAASALHLPAATLSAPVLLPSALPASAAPSLTAGPAAPAALAPSALPAAAAPGRAAALPSRLRAAGDGPTPLQAPLRPGEPGDPRLGTGDTLVHDGPRGRWLVPLSSFERPLEPADWRAGRASLDRTFDGAAVRAGSVADAPVAGAPGAAAKPLAAATGAAPKPSAAVPAARPAPRSPARSFAWRLALTLALFLLTPAVALAQTAAAPITISVGGTLATMAALRPAFAAVGAIAGAVFGMAAARPKAGEETSSAEVLASVLRYGALGGASVYMLFDVTNMAFNGAGAGISSLSSAVVTAALGRTAFQGKFKDLTTTSADRIVGAFPAVAAALGISLGVAAGFVGAPLWATAALGAMTVTGVATALYTALFKPGRSPMAGPATMGKGYVLQALMTGMALAVTQPWLQVFFGVMGAAGFGLVLWGTGRELRSLLPGKGEPLPPPPPPAPPAPPPGKEPPPIGDGPTTARIKPGY